MNEEEKFFTSIPLSYGNYEQRQAFSSILYELTGWLSLNSCSNLWSDFLDHSNENFLEILPECKEIIEIVGKRWLESNPSTSNFLLLIDQIITRIKDIKILLKERNSTNFLSNSTIKKSIFSSSSSLSGSSTTSSTSLLLANNKNINLKQYNLSLSKGLYFIGCIIQLFFSLLPLDEVKAQLGLSSQWPYNYLESFTHMRNSMNFSGTSTSSSGLHLKSPPYNLLETLIEEVVGLISYETDEINELKFFSITFLITLFSTELNYVPSFFNSEENESKSSTIFSPSSASIFLDFFHIKGYQQLSSSLQVSSDSSLYTNSFPVQLVKGLLHAICSSNSVVASSSTSSLLSSNSVDYLSKISTIFINKEIEFEKNILNSSISSPNTSKSSTSIVSSVTSSLSIWKGMQGLLQGVFRKWVDQQNLLPSTNSSLDHSSSENNLIPPSKSLPDPIPSETLTSVSCHSNVSPWYFYGSKFPLLPLNERACQLLLLLLYTKNDKKRKSNSFYNAYQEIFLLLTNESNNLSLSSTSNSPLSTLESGLKYFLPGSSGCEEELSSFNNSEDISSFLMKENDKEKEIEKLNYFKIFFNLNNLINNIVKQFSLSSTPVSNVSSFSSNSKLISVSLNSLHSLTYSSTSLSSLSTSFFSSASSFKTPSAIFLSTSTISYSNSNNFYSIFLFYYFLIQNYNINSIFSSPSSTTSTSASLSDKKIFLSFINNLSLHVNKMIQKAKLKLVQKDYLDKEEKERKDNKDFVVDSSSLIIFSSISLDEVHDLNHLYLLVISLFIFSTQAHEYLASFFMTSYNVNILPLHENFFNNKNYNYNLYNSSTTATNSSETYPYSSASFLFIDLLLYVLLKIFNFLIFHLNSDDYLTSNIIGLLLNLINFSSHFSSYISEKLIKFLIILGKKILLNIENYEKKISNSSTINSSDDNAFFSRILQQRKILSALLEFTANVIKTKKDNVPLLYALIIDIEPFTRAFTSSTMKNFLNLDEEEGQNSNVSIISSMNNEESDCLTSSTNSYIEFIISEANFYLKKLENREKEFRKMKRDGGISAEVMMHWLWEERAGKVEKTYSEKASDIEEQAGLLQPTSSSSSSPMDPKNFSPRYMYHETDEPEVFFLPCIWVQIVQKSPDIPWNFNKLKIF